MASSKGSPQLQPDAKDKVLIILTSFGNNSADGPPGHVSATSFIETYVHLSTTPMQISIATPAGQPPEFKFENEKTKQWIQSKANLWYNVKSLGEIRDTDFSAVVVPHCLGGLQDLASTDSSCAKFISSYLLLNRPLCTIGFGVSALLGSLKPGLSGSKSALQGRCITGPSNAEVSRYEFFKQLGNQQVEDTLRERGAKYTCSPVDQTHVVVDGNLVSAQNTQSASLALQNLIWIWKQLTQSRMPNLEI